MTTQTYPSSLLPTQTYSTFRTWNWKTRLYTAESGFERRQADQPFPRSEWTLKYDILREQVDARQSGGGLGTGLDELYSLLGFYLQQNGPLVPFLFVDPTDNAVTGGPLGTGDGSTLAFQFVRQLGTLGGISPYFEPIAFINTSTAQIYLNNILQTSGYSLEPGAYVKFTSAPGSGVLVTASFSYYWLVRFSTPSMDFANFMFQLWNAQTVKLRQCLTKILPT